MPQVRNKKTGEVKEVGEVVAKDAKLLANMGYELVNPNEFPQQPEPEKKSVKPVVDYEIVDETPEEAPENEIIEQEPVIEEPTVTEKRKYTKRNQTI